MALLEQPFGFTSVDVDDEEQVAASCEQMSGQLEVSRDGIQAATACLTARPKRSLTPG